MTKAHHLIRYFVVRELPRIGKPTPPELIFDCRGPMSTTRRFEHNPTLQIIEVDHSPLCGLC
jgi:hypothetical protein